MKYMFIFLISAALTVTIPECRPPTTTLVKDPAASPPQVPSVSSNNSNDLWSEITVSNTLVHFNQNFRDTSNTYFPKSASDCGNPNGYNMTLLSVVKSIIYNCSGGVSCISAYKTQFYNPNIGYTGLKSPDHFYNVEVIANYQGYNPDEPGAIDKNYDIEKAMVAALAYVVAKIMTTDKQNNYCENNSDSTTDANNSPIDRNRYGYNYRRYEAIPSNLEINVYNGASKNIPIYNMSVKITESSVETTKFLSYCSLLGGLFSTPLGYYNYPIAQFIGATVTVSCLDALQ